MKRPGSLNETTSNPICGESQPTKFAKLIDGNRRATETILGADRIISQKTIFNFEIETIEIQCESQGFYSTVPKNVNLSQKNNRGILELSKEDHDNIESLNLKDINQNVTVALTDSLSKLQELAIGAINGKIDLPILNNIQTIDIQRICDTEIQIPIGSKKCILNIGAICGKVQIALTNDSYCQVELWIGCIEEDSDFTLIDSSNKLKLLDISKIGENAKISLPNCNNCDGVAFGKIPTKFNHDWPFVFDTCISNEAYDRIMVKTSTVDHMRCKLDRIHNFAKNHVNDLCEKGIWQKGKEFAGILPNLIPILPKQPILMQNSTNQPNTILPLNPIQSSITGMVLGISNFFTGKPAVKEEIQVDNTKIIEDRKQRREQEAQKKREKLKPLMDELLYGADTLKPREKNPDQKTGTQPNTPIILN